MTRSESPRNDAFLLSADQERRPDRSSAELARLIEELLSLASRWSDEYRKLTDHKAPSDEVSLAELRPVVAAESVGSGVNPPTIPIGDWARKIYDDRRARDRVFNDLELFGEPAWDILLDLAVAEAAGQCLPVSSVCIGSCVPPTTALRWIKVLENRGLIRRENDLLDARRSFIRLTRLGVERMERYFAELSRKQKANTLFFSPQQ